MAIRKVNYVNNKDLLKEIHKSKNSFCWYKNHEFSDYDLIIFEMNEMHQKLEEARIARAARLSKVSIGDDATEFSKVQPESIQDHEIVFRIMTWDHIPEAPPKPKKVKKAAKTPVILEDEDEADDSIDDIVADVREKTEREKHVKVNFPPFAHYRFDQNGHHELVGLSHWVGGDRHTGHFSKDHGSITNELAKMFVKLCERYGTKWNWRGYTYNDEMQSQALLQLSNVGLQFNEAKSQNPFAYFTTTVKNSFTHVFNVEHQHQELRDDILEMNSLNPSYSRQNTWNGDDHGGDE